MVNARTAARMLRGARAYDRCMAHTMSDAERRAFLSDGTRTAKLATTLKDGRPHVLPVWFVLDGDDLLFNTEMGSIKGRNLARERRACVCVDDQAPPYSFVMVQGRVTITEDPEQVRESTIRIARRYMGAERGREFGERNTTPGMLLVRLTPERTFAIADTID